MATITLEIPEELAVRLDPLRDRLPELLSQLLDSESATSFMTGNGSFSHSCVVAPIRRSAGTEMLRVLLAPPRRYRLCTPC
jgi:hypothetical protein